MVAVPLLEEMSGSPSGATAPRRSSSIPATAVLATAPPRPTNATPRRCCPDDPTSCINNTPNEPRPTDG